MSNLMDNIEARRVAVLQLIAGDATHLHALCEHYAYIARESARYIYYLRGVKSVPLEDVEQQAHFLLVDALSRKVRGSERESLADVNHHPKYEDCLGVRPYLITTIRKKLQDFITESGIIKVPHSTFEEARIKKYGEKQIPVVESMFGINGGQEFTKPDAEPIEGETPEETIMLREMVERLRLTYLERQILEMRTQSYTLEEIGHCLGKDKATISRKLKRIGDKWLSANS